MTTKKLKQIFDDIEKGKTLLPKFQRGFVWDRKKQQTFLSSFIVNLPYGSVLELEGNKDNSFTSRALCFQDVVPPQMDECDYILDGQQRLTTLKSALTDLYSASNWRQSVHDRLFSQLQNRWYLNVELDCDECIDKKKFLFGYDTLIFDDMSYLTDEDLFDFIYCAKIRIGDDNNIYYWSPDFNKNDTPEPIEELYNAKKIPLFWGEKKASLTRLLRTFADSRATFLKNKFEVEIQSNIFESVKKWINARNLVSVSDESDLLKPDNVGRFIELERELDRASADWQIKTFNFLTSLLERDIPTIHLKSKEINRAAAIFQAINKGGQPLSVFELLTAKVSVSGVDFVESLNQSFLSGVSLQPNIINSHYNNDSWTPTDFDIQDNNEPSKQVKDWFVNVLSVLSYCTIDGKTLMDVKVDYIKKDLILGLPLTDIQTKTDRTIIALNRAFCFFNLRLGVQKASEIPYKLMFVVISVLLEIDNVWQNSALLNKIEYWYWSALFGGQYFYRQNESCVKDIRNLYDFLINENNHFSGLRDMILNVPSVITKDIMMRRERESSASNDMATESSSVKEGLMQFILSLGPRDFVSDPSGNDYKRYYAWTSGLKLEIHHIYPLGTATSLKQSTRDIRSNKQHILNSALNLTPIKSETNRVISDYAPSIYFEEFKTHPAVFASHAIPPDFATENQDVSRLLALRFDSLLASINQKLDSLYSN